MDRAISAAGHGGAWLADNPLAVLILGALIALGLGIHLMRRSAGAVDPVRMYSSAQRMEGFARAGNRCEMRGWLPGLRCRRPAQHGDHFYPHSRGGATSMSNFVAACARCNMSKSNRLPTLIEGWEIALRRRRYFPPGVPRLPGQRYV